MDVTKYHAVHAVPAHSDDYELVGIFTLERDALEFRDEAEKSGKYLAVTRPEHLEMQAILDILARDRLRELADQIAKLAAVVTPN